MPSVETLANGVRVVADPMPGLETVALGVWVRAGAMDETPAEHGVAHLLEHMAFKGTTTRSARAIAEEIEAVGGYLNAATSHERTGYYARVLKSDFACAADILADILRAPLLDGAELAKEREVVVQEIGEALDTPDDVVFEKLSEVAWGRHPLGRTILGTPESVRKQTPESLRGFMGRRYQPEEMIVAASGGLDAAALNAIAQQCFGGFAATAPGPMRAAGVFHAGLHHDDRDTEQTHLALAFPGVETTHEDFIAMRLYAEILGGGLSSRLFQKIREERGLAYSVYAFSDSFECAGLLGAYVNAEAAQIPECASIILQEMTNAVATIGDDEIARAKALVRSSFMMGLESPAARIEAAAGQLYAYGRLLTPAEILERVAAVTPDDLRRCARWALSGPVAASIVGPCDAARVDRLIAAG